MTLPHWYSAGLEFDGLLIRATTDALCYGFDTLSFAKHWFNTGYSAVGLQNSKIHIRSDQKVALIVTLRTTATKFFPH